MSANNNKESNIFKNSKIALKGGDYTTVNRDASVKTIIESYNPFFANFFKNREQAEQAMTIALDVSMDSKFDNCNKHSIVKAIIDTYRLGLNPTPGIDHTYLVPYNGNIKLMISSKGFTSLLFKAGWLVESFPIYKCDDFLHAINENGQKINFVQNWKERNIGDKDWVYQNLEAIYLVAKHITGQTKVLVVYKSEIEKLRLVSPSQTFANPKYSTSDKIKRVASKLPVDIWDNWYEEMGIAKSIKKLAKQLPLGDDRWSSMVKLAVNVDDYTDINNDEMYEKALNHVNINNSNVEEKKNNGATDEVSIKVDFRKELKELNIQILKEAVKGNRTFLSIRKLRDNEFQNLAKIIEKYELSYKLREKDIVLMIDNKGV